MTDTDAVDDAILFSNSPAQADSLLHSLEQVVGIDIHVNANKIEFKWFKEVAVSTLNGMSPKLVDQLTHLGNKISSTESDLNMLTENVYYCGQVMEIISKKLDRFLSSCGCQYYCMIAPPRL